MMRTKALARRTELTFAAVGIVASLVLWQLVSVVFAKPLLLPTAVAAFQAWAGIAEDGTLTSELALTLGRMAEGFAIGLLIGAPLGLLMGHVPLVRWCFEPYVHFFRFVTPIALLSLIITWVGAGDQSKVALVAYVTGFIVLLNAMAGALAVPSVTLRAARALGAGPQQLFLDVVVPASIRSVLVGARIALGYAFMTVIAAEMIMNDSGMGSLIWNSQLFAKTDVVFASLLALGLVGLALDIGFTRLAQRVFMRFGSLT